MLTRAPDPGLALDLLRLQVAAGAPLGDVATLPARGRRALAVASAVGAPVLAAIDGAQAAEDDAARARRAVAVASAQTRAVAGGLLAAPLLLVPGLGRLVGADLVAFYSSGLGVAVLAVGLTLLGTGGIVIVVLVRRVGRPPSAAGSRTGWVAAVGAGLVLWKLVGIVAGVVAAVLAHRLVRRRDTGVRLDGVDEVADLVATALAGGVGAPEALRLIAEQLPALAGRLGRLAFGLELGMGTEACAASSVRRRRSGAPADGFARLALVLATAEELGAAIAPTLRHLARDLRADDLADVLAAAERLPAQLTFPTALCLLPATVLLVGAPIVHAGLVAAGT